MGQNSSVTGVWCNKIHKCSVKSGINPAFSRKNGVLHPSHSEKAPSLNVPIYICESYSKAPSLWPPLNQTFRDGIQTLVFHKYLKRGKYFPRTVQQLISLGAWSPRWHLSWSLSWKFNQHWHTLQELWVWLKNAIASWGYNSSTDMESPWAGRTPILSSSEGISWEKGTEKQ